MDTREYKVKDRSQWEVAHVPLQSPCLIYGIFNKYES